VGAGLALAADQVVAIQSLAFSPGSVTVNVGDSVTWTNNDTMAHTATADDDSWDTGSLAQGASESLTFDTAGEFAYHCEFHSNMTGTVVVQAAPGGGSPAPTNPPTDTVAGEPAQPSNMLTGGVLAFLGAVIFAVVFLVDRRLDSR
jgi:hypothetical protein